MDSASIAALLRPFIGADRLSERQLEQTSIYIDLLLRWNARINLTAVRDPENIVTRHFGESLFAANQLCVSPDRRPGQAQRNSASSTTDQRRKTRELIDVGSGAGFPGLPMKIWAPDLYVTLIESNHKKATFLREVVRALSLTGADVFSGRAEDFASASADLVTLRAVERFENVLPLAARLVRPEGRLALFIGESQVKSAHAGLLEFRWDDPKPIPLSSSRVLLVGNAKGESTK